MKQVIVIRKDLKMRRGKECAQAGHAAMKWLSNYIKASPHKADWGRFAEDDISKNTYQVTLSDLKEEWLFGDQKKICLQVESEEELLQLHKTALEAGLESHYVVDSGLTEFGGVSTITCLAIGPNSDTAVDLITGHLKLY